MNPLDDVPLNTKRVYVMGKTKDGCEVYMPVDSRKSEVIQEKKKQLQDWLNKQSSEEPSVA